MDDVTRVGQLRSDQFLKWVYTHMKWLKSDSTENAAEAYQELQKYLALCHLEYVLMTNK